MSRANNCIAAYLGPKFQIRVPFPISSSIARIGIANCSLKLPHNSIVSSQLIPQNSNCPLDYGSQLLIPIVNWVPLPELPLAIGNCANWEFEIDENCLALAHRRPNLDDCLLDPRLMIRLSLRALRRPWRGRADKVSSASRGNEHSDHATWRARRKRTNPRCRRAR